MPKEPDTNLGNFTPLQTPQKSNLNLAGGVFVLLAILLLWSPFIIRGSLSFPAPPRPHPSLLAIEEFSPPPAPLPAPPPPALRPLTELELLEELIWTARVAVLIIGLGVLGIFAVSSRLKKLSNRHDQEIDLMMGLALDQQGDSLPPLGNGLAPRLRCPSWDDPADWAKSKPSN